MPRQGSGSSPGAGMGLRRGVVLALVLVLVACGREGRKAGAGVSAGARASADPDAAPGADAGARASADADTAVGAGAGSGTGTGTARGDDEDYLSGVPSAARSIGHTSVVFKVELSTGKKGAFKPASRRGPVRYKGEIAARRLGVALGLANVPRAFFRTMDANAMAAAAGSGAAGAGELFAKEAIVRDNVVKGALMPWIDRLEFVALEREPLVSQWKAWLKDGETIPEDQRALAGQISTLVAFDFVTGNWDRWSGGNVGIDKASGTLLFIDNDGAFFEVPPADALQRNKKLLMGVDRFSRSFVAHVRELDDAALTRALGEESAGVPLLSAKALAGVLQRRKELLQILDAKRADAGEDALLPFP